MDNKAFLLDTNAYFNILCYFSNKSNFNQLGEEQQNEIQSVLKADCYISQVTLVEIISVIGKYSRGTPAHSYKCNCVISSDGNVCNNQIFKSERKTWSRKQIKSWLKLTNDITNGESEVLKIKTVDFNEETIHLSLQIIQKALKFNFASMDALIAATSQQMSKEIPSVTIVTSDKSLKLAINELKINYLDAFKPLKYTG